MQEYTRQLMSFVLNTRYEDIPADVIELAKKHFLDCVGAVLAEVAEPRSEIVQRCFTAFGSTGECRIPGHGRKVTVENAAFATGILAHTICFDDSGPSHPSVTVVPGLIAMGEQYHFSGRELLAAQVMGYEVFQRLNAVTAEAWEMRKRGWHPTGFFGSVSGAAQSARMMGLDLETAQRALGIAATLGGGLSQNIGNMGMGLHAGNASRNGILAAHLAREGFTADPQPLEGRFGLMDALCGPGTYDISLLTQDLGASFRLKNPGITIKPYPNCWAHHKVLQATLELVARYDIRPEDVERIEVDLQLDKPTYRYVEPKTDLEARYSLSYGIALAILDRELTLAQYADDRIQRADSVAMMRRIFHTPKDTAAQQQVISILTRDGSRYENAVAFSKGHPLHDPLTMAEVQDKYRLCAGRILPPSQVEASMDAILHLEDVADFSRVLDLLVV
ncbi:MAG: MmgE/PrpD family protein [Lawsonibacter sp.]|nr:MmgE/PrpD family protein [Lawsonibacter sp.]